MCACVCMCDREREREKEKEREGTAEEEVVEPSINKSTHLSPQASCRATRSAVCLPLSHHSLSPDSLRQPATAVWFSHPVNKAPALALAV